MICAVQRGIICGKMARKKTEENNYLNIFEKNGQNYVFGDKINKEL